MVEKMTLTLQILDQLEKYILTSLRDARYVWGNEVVEGTVKDDDRKI